MNWDQSSAALKTEMAFVIQQPKYAFSFLKKLASQLKAKAFRLSPRDGYILWIPTLTFDEKNFDPKLGVVRKLGPC